MKKKEIILIIVAILCIVAGLCIFFFPYLNNYLYEKDIEEEKDNFIEKNLSEDNSENNKLEELYQELNERNAELYETNQKGLTDPFSYEQANIDLSEYGIEDNIIGYITIPKIEIELPIILGANTENMKKGAVHLTRNFLPNRGN